MLFLTIILFSLNLDFLFGFQFIVLHTLSGDNMSTFVIFLDVSKYVTLFQYFLLYLLFYVNWTKFIFVYYW